MRRLPAALLLALPFPAAAHPMHAPGAALEHPSPVTAESLRALCYHHGLAYSEGAMIAVSLPDPEREAARGGPPPRPAILHCQRVDGDLRWTLLR